MANSPTSPPVRPSSDFSPTAGVFPDPYAGQYFFSDYIRAWIRRLDPVTKQVTGFATGIEGTLDLEFGPDGALWGLTEAGSIVRISVSRPAHSARTPTRASSSRNSRPAS